MFFKIYLRNSTHRRLRSLTKSLETVKLYNRSCNLYFCLFAISMGKQKQLLLSYNPTLIPSKAHQSFQKNRFKREKSGNKSLTLNRHIKIKKP